METPPAPATGALAARAAHAANTPGHARTPRRSTGTDEGQERGGGNEQYCKATFRSTPRSRRQALSTFPWTSKVCLPPWRQVAGAGSAAPGGPDRRPPRLRCRFLMSLCPDGEWLLDVLRFFEPKIILEDIPARRLCREAAAGGTVGGSANYPVLP